MGTEREQGCVGQRDELTRLMCEAAEPSRALRAHLAECGACRETLAATRELANALRTALQPEPLPAALAARIRGAVDERACEAEAHKAELCKAELCTTGARAWVWPWRIATGAAAAALAAAVLIPAIRPTTMPPTNGAPDDTVRLTPDDAALAATCWSLIAWDSPMADSVQYIAERVSEVARTVARDPAGERLLPWSTAEDWDVPKGEGGASRSGSNGPVCVGRQAGVVRDCAS